MNKIVLTVFLVTIMLAPRFHMLLPRVEAQEPYFHQYSNSKSFFVGGIPEEQDGQSHSDIINAVTLAAFQGYKQNLEQSVDRNGDVVTVRDVGTSVEGTGSYVDPDTGRTYYNYKIHLWSLVSGNFEGSPIDPLTIALLAFLIPKIVALILAAVVVIIVAGYVVGWVTDITTETYEKVWYDSEGNIIATEWGQTPTVNVTDWVIIIAVTVVIAVLITTLAPILVKRKRK